MMSQANAQPVETWDDEWHFSQGLLEDSGFMNKASGFSVMTELGEKINTSKGICKITNTRRTTIKSGVVEIEFISNTRPEYDGFRIVLSNGTNGLQLYVVGKGLFYNEGDLAYAKKIMQINTGIIYKIRAFFNSDGKNVIYVNDVKVLESSVFSNFYAYFNSIYQQNGGETILRSVKYKYNRI